MKGKPSFVDKMNEYDFVDVVGQFFWQKYDMVPVILGLQGAQIAAASLESRMALLAAEEVIVSLSSSIL